MKKIGFAIATIFPLISPHAVAWDNVSSVENCSALMSKAFQYAQNFHYTDFFGNPYDERYIKATMATIRQGVTLDPSIPYDPHLVQPPGSDTNNLYPLVTFGHSGEGATSALGGKPDTGDVTQLEGDFKVQFSHHKPYSTDQNFLDDQYPIRQPGEKETGLLHVTIAADGTFTRDLVKYEGTDLPSNPRELHGSCTDSVIYAEDTTSNPPTFYAIVFDFRAYEKVGNESGNVGGATGYNPNPPF